MLCARESCVQRRVDLRRITIIIFYIYNFIIIIKLHGVILLLFFFFYLVTDSFFFLPFAAGWNVYLPYTPMWMDINRISGASERARPGFSLLY